MSEGAIKKISRVVFWRYQRGGWQYDILCIFILLFIFLVPRSVLDGSYFSDGEAATGIEVMEESQSAAPSSQEQPPTEDNQVPAAD